jgi:hypothetical protein
MILVCGCAIRGAFVRRRLSAPRGNAEKLYAFGKSHESAGKKVRLAGKNVRNAHPLTLDFP